MPAILVTNNPLVSNRFNHLETVFLENATLLDVFINVRDKIHQGAKLLSHPLTGSIKPDETPYKSILITQTATLEALKVAKLDFNSLDIISNSIETAEKFLKGKNIRNYTQSILEDFQAIDLAIITSGIESMGGYHGE